MIPNYAQSFLNKILPSAFDCIKNMDGVINPSFPTLIYASLIECLHYDLNHFAILILESAIRSLDLSFRYSPQRCAAYHVRGNPVRTLHTVFGDLTFKRTLYNDIYDKHHLFCFVDYVLGLPKYIRYDPCIRSLVFTYSLKLNSMEKVGMAVGDMIQGFSLGLQKRKYKCISKQTVSYILHSSPSFSTPVPKRDVTPDHIYVMSDEKYKSLQNEHSDNGKAKKTMIKMAIIFEGVEHIGNRNKLIAPYTVIGYSSTFWQDVLDVLHARYDMNKVKLITTMGDGASWIYASAAELKTPSTNTRFLLDAFHAKQAINRISTKTENRELLCYYLTHDEIKEFKHLVEMIEKGKKPDRIERIEKQWKYLHSRWQDAVDIFKSEIGCSMESHIEHNLATLISSVPKAYSRGWLEKLVKLIAHDKNGEDMQELYLKSLTMKQKDGIVNFKETMDFSMFDKKADTYDKSTSSKSIGKLLNNISVSG